MEEAGIQFHLHSPLRGWLRRHGGVMRGWQRKFFVLKEGCLFCFNREDDTQLSSTYLLDDYHLRDVPANPEDPDKFVFELVKENTGDSVTLCAASDAEKKEWLKALCYHIYAGKGGAIFGLPLEEAMKYEHRQGRTVPHIVQTCVQHLERFALDTEGIFRLAGRAGLMRELRAKFETGQQPDLENVDVHTVGSLLKAYLRELPESLVPPDMYQRVMNCAMRHAEASSDESKQTEVECLCRLLEELPDINYTALAYICRFLQRLAANADKTKMTAHNLSLVFGPNLIRHLDSSPELLMLTADLTQHLVFMLITHCSQVLPSRPQREAVPRQVTADGPTLREKRFGAVNLEDLLRLSQPLDPQDPTLLPPRPTALRDLMGLQLCPQRMDSDDKSQSPITPPSPFTFINDYYDQTDRRVSQKREEVRSGEAGGASEADAVVTRPVAPRRNKSRSMRNRRSAGTPSSPMSPDSPRQLDSQDILAALASVSRDQAGCAQLEQSSEGLTSDRSPPSGSSIPVALGNDEPGHESQRSDRSSRVFRLGNHQRLSGNGPSSSTNNVCNGKSSSADIWKTRREDSVPGTDSERIRPSHTVLEAQVSALTSELASVKERSEHMVRALKNQLMDIQAKYEARLTSLEAQQRREVMDLVAKLDAERSARANAVERTVSLQAQLYKYKLQYGELPDSHTS